LVSLGKGYGACSKTRLGLDKLLEKSAKGPVFPLNPEKLFQKLNFWNSLYGESDPNPFSPLNPRLPSQKLQSWESLSLLPVLTGVLPVPLYDAPGRDIDRQEAWHPLKPFRNIKRAVLQGRETITEGRNFSPLPFPSV
jgi:hypothetical protein